MGLINKISKTRFMAGLNCPRYFSLFEIYKQKEKSLISFKDDLSDLYDEENIQRKKELLDEMYELNQDNEEVDNIKREDESHEIMMPYYKEIELLSSMYAKHLFKKDVIFSFDTKEQKMFQTEIKGYYFYCFLDGYQELNDSVNVIESKAITSNNFFKEEFKINDEKYKIFELSKNGILMTRESLGLQIGGNYKEVINRITDRNHPIGSYVYDLTFQRFVIENSKDLDNKNVRYLLAVLNHEYIFDGTYKDGKPDYIKDIDNNFIIRYIDVTDLTHYAMDKFKQDLEVVIDRLNKMTFSLEDELCPRKGKHVCMFHDICYQNIPKKNSIFTLLYNHHGFKDEKGNKYLPKDLIKMNIVSIDKMPYDWLTRPINKIQYDAVVNHKTYIKKERIKEIIDHLVYPLYHLDFESFPCPLPRFKGEKPYSQSVFQFNLHIENKDKETDLILDSYHYLATDHEDHRKELLAYLLSLIDEKGTIVAWNDKFEIGRLKEFAVFYPEYEDKINDIIDRTYDLMAIFKGNNHKIYKKWNIEADEGINYYDEKLQGSYSIKKVLPIFVPEMNYDILEVKNGNEAMVTYGKFPQMDTETFNNKKEALITYCRQDTFAMVKLLTSLRKIV